MAQKTKHKILILRASNFYGGPERQIYQHAFLGKGSEFEMIIGSFSENGNAPEFINKSNKSQLKTCVLYVDNAYDFNSISLLRNYIIEENIDILCTHDYRSNFIAFLAKRGLAVKWIAFSRGWTNESIKISLYHLLDNIFMRFANCIIAVSHSQKKKIQRFLISTNKIQVVQNSVNLEELDQIPAIDIRREFLLPSDSIIISSAGRFSREKGQKYLVDAALDLVKQNDKLYFILFGDGPDYEKLQSLIKSEEQQSRILTPGFSKHIIAYLKGGVDILVNPSLSEAMPNVVLEAMALNIPVLATNVGGVPEIIEDGVSGQLIPAGDRLALINGLTDLINDKSKCKRFAEQGRIEMGKYFNFEIQFKRLTGIYLNLLGN